MKWAKWWVIAAITLAVDIAMYARNPVLRDVVNGQAWIYYLYLSAMTGVVCWVITALVSRLLNFLLDRRSDPGRT